MFDINFPIKSIGVFLSIPIISIILGLFVGLLACSRAILSNTVLMIVMMMGYFGGAISLTSVLSNTKFMNVLMYLSPLTRVNRLIFKDLIQVNRGNDLWIWILTVLVFATVLISLMGRRVKDGAII
ncbi:MAG: hypothetical protein SPI74_01615 [Eubacterium sp.]|nr:hypothetical protein [Eubacterium sp.]